MTRLMLPIALLIAFLAPEVRPQGSANVTFLGNVNPYPAVGYNDCWGYTAPDGREYAFLGVLNGTSFIDITNPANMHEVDFVPSNTSTWKDIKTYRHYAYVVTEAGPGLQVIDLRYLPDSVHLVYTYTGFVASHNISIDTANAMLYAEGSGTQYVRAISLANPTLPVQVSYFGISSHDVLGQDNIVYVSEGSNGSIGIFDLSVPTNPRLLKRFSIPASGYVHNAWPTPDHQYLMTTEETLNKTIKLWRISDTSNIVITDDYLASPGIAHNTHIKGNYAYISHYLDGLRIVDISNPDSIFEAGYYDTFPGPGGSFSGCWGAFPFYGSGKVLASDRSTGLYVVHFAGAVTPVKENRSNPEQFSIDQNYPNPFNPTTTLRFSLPKESAVSLTIYDILGREVVTLVDAVFEQGTHRIEWNATAGGREAASGVYLARMTARDGNGTMQFTATRRMVLVR